MTDHAFDDVAAEPAVPAVPERTVGLFWLVVAPLVLVLGVVGGAVAVAAGSGGDGHREDTHVATAEPLDLLTVPAQVADHYRYARDHRSELSAIPCFCGCEEFLAHRNLYDCFVRADGLGYDSHAAGCAVCIGEVVTASRLLDDAVPVPEVARRVIAEFGTTPVTSPDQTIPAD